MSKSHIVGVLLILLVVGSGIGAAVHHIDRDRERDLLLLQYRSQLNEYEAAPLVGGVVRGREVILARVPVDGAPCELILRRVAR